MTVHIKGEETNRRFHKWPRNFSTTYGFSSRMQNSHQR